MIASFSHQLCGLNVTVRAVAGCDVLVKLCFELKQLGRKLEPDVS
jgi:hypothetical protein